MGLLQKKSFAAALLYIQIFLQRRGSWAKKMEPMIGFDKTDDSPSQSRSECCGNHLQ
jgi:hypothetical protein